MEVYTFLVVAAPAGTPSEIIDAINLAVTEEMLGTNGQPAIVPPGREASAMTPAEVAEFLDAERVKWEPIIIATGIGK
jgi:tripartite-type tricarboxylate transporter receptor subunit TctC